MPKCATITYFATATISLDKNGLGIGDFGPFQVFLAIGGALDYCHARLPQWRLKKALQCGLGFIGTENDDIEVVLMLVKLVELGQKVKYGIIAQLSGAQDDVILGYVAVLGQFLLLHIDDGDLLNLNRNDAKCKENDAHDTQL